MEKTSIKDKAYFVWYSIGLLLLTLTILWILSHFKDIIALLIVCTLLSYLLSPMVNFLSNPIDITLRDYIKVGSLTIKIPWEKTTIKTKKGLPRVLSITASFIFVGIIIALLFFYIVPLASQELQNLYANRVVYKESIIKTYNNAVTYIDLHTPATIKAYIPDFSKNIDITSLHGVVKQAVGSSLPAVKNFMNSVAHFILVPFVTFYILMDYDVYRKSLLSLIPAKRQKEVQDLLGEIDMMLRQYIRGQLLVCFIIGVSVTVAMLAMKIPYAILIGIFAGVIDVIPYIGVILSMIPAALFALLKSPVYALFVLLVLYIIHWIEGHVIIPNIMGHSIDLPPLTVIVALIIGAEMMGIVGMFLAVPVAAVLRVVIGFYVRKREDAEAMEASLSETI